MNSMWPLRVVIAGTISTRWRNGLSVFSTPACSMKAGDSCNGYQIPVCSTGFSRLKVLLLRRLKPVLQTGAHEQRRFGSLDVSLYWIFTDESLSACDLPGRRSFPRRGRGHGTSAAASRRG